MFLVVYMYSFYFSLKFDRSFLFQYLTSTDFRTRQDIVISKMCNKVTGICIVLRRNVTEC